MDEAPARGMSRELEQQRQILAEMQPSNAVYMREIDLSGLAPAVSTDIKSIF